MNVGIEVETQLGGIFEQMEVLAETVRPAFEDFAQRILVETAWGTHTEAWPVDTGESQASWDVVVEEEAGNLVVLLRNYARSWSKGNDPGGRSYAAYIHRAGDDPENKVWMEKEDSIIANEVPRLLEECVEIIAKSVEV